MLAWWAACSEAATHNTGYDQQEHGRGEHVAVTPAEVRGDQSADDAREQDAAEHRRELCPERAPAMFRLRDLGGDRDEVLHQRRADARHQAACRQDRDRWRHGHQRLSERHHDDLGEHQCALVDTIPERHEQHDADEQAAKGKRRYPARRRGVCVEVRGYRGQHRRLIVNAAGHDKSRYDQEGDETAMLARGCGQIRQW